MIQFKYNDKIYDTSDLEKKLKKMNITINDIVIIEKQPDKIENNGIKKFYFKNKNKDSKEFGFVVCSIFSTLERLGSEIEINDYELIK